VQNYKVSSFLGDESETQGERRVKLFNSIKSQENTAKKTIFNFHSKSLHLKTPLQRILNPEMSSPCLPVEVPDFGAKASLGVSASSDCSTQQTIYQCPKITIKTCTSSGIGIVTLKVPNPKTKSPLRNLILHYSNFENTFLLLKN